MWAHVFDASVLVLMLWIASSLQNIAHHTKATYDIVWSSIMNKPTVDEILSEIRAKNPANAAHSID